MMLILKRYNALISKSDHFPTKPYKKSCLCFFHIGICHGTQIIKIQLSWDQVNYCALQESLCFAHCHICICQGTQIQKNHIVSTSSAMPHKKVVCFVPTVTFLLVTLRLAADRMVQFSD